MSITLTALQKQRRDTAANWTSVNPTLLAGEIGIESDTNKWKVGTGSAAWTALAYMPGSQLSAYPIVNVDISATAEIAVSKLADGTPRQLLQTDAAGTGVEWASNIDIPGTLDVTSAATFDNNVIIQGDLTVNGTTTTIDTTNLAIEDKNIEIGKVTTPSDVTADGGGITLKATVDKTITWIDATDAWTFSEHVNIVSTKEYRIAGTKVLDATSLGSAVVSSSLTSVGTIGTGVWNGTAITDTYLATIATAGKVSNSATTATDANTASAIVARDASGNFTAGTIAAALTGAASSNVLKAGDTMTGVLAVTAGTAALPAITPSGDPNTGIYSPGADQVAISTNGTGRLFINASGLVSAGTTSANSRFTAANISTTDAGAVELKGQRTFVAETQGATAVIATSNQTRNSHDFGAIRFEQNPDTSNGGAALARFFVGGTSSSFASACEFIRGTAATTDGANNIQFRTLGNERMRLDSSGRLGLGTSSPGSALEINAAAATSPFIAKINTAEAARIDSSGRLLVGTSSAFEVEGFNRHSYFCPAAGDTNNHVVVSAVSTGFPSLFFTRTRGATPTTFTVVQNGDTLGSMSFFGADGSDYSAQAASIGCLVDGTPGANDMPGRLVFSVTADGAASPTEAMRINNAGELLVGYTTDNGAYKLQVNSQIFATSATVATSDGRYKENVASLGGCLDLVKALRPVSFTWKPQKDVTRTDDEGNEVLVREGHNFPEGTQVGFIAQEVQEVLTDKPWLNSVIKENVRPAVLDSEGNELAPEEQFYGIAEGNLIAVLTNALQEAIAEIASLTDRVAALEGE
jgi:hypothetical protein